MVIDDDDFSQEMVAGMLEQWGVTGICTANNGRNALHALARMARMPDFLICDVFMPDMDGIEFLGELATRNFQGGVILMSGMDPQMMEIARDVAQMNKLQVVATFLKPLQHELLAQALGLAGKSA
jgi:CheY-like chemotaxis protein